VSAVLRFRREDDGSVELDLPEEERLALDGLLGELLELLGAGVAATEPGPSAPSHPSPTERPDPADRPDPSDPAALAALVGIGSSSEPPTDPVSARLFPAAYADAAAAGDFRRYTEQRLRDRKIAGASAARATWAEGAGPWRLDAQAQQVWLGALNDLRLALGTLLEIDEDDDPQERMAQAVGEDGDGGYWLYVWLTDLQADLLAALTAPPG